jgi:lysophospholipase L1-like esterase
MKISILGDSISTFEGYLPKDYPSHYPAGNVRKVEQTWWYQVIERNGWTLGFNNSYSGSRVSNTLLIQLPHSNLADDSRILNYNSDVIIVFAGTNDFGARIKQPTLSQFKEKYQYMLNGLIEKNPNTKLFLCTPLRRRDLKTKQKSKIKLSNISKTIKEIGSIYECCNIIDLYSHRIKLSDFFYIDGLHPNAKGMRIISNWIEKDISKC